MKAYFNSQKLFLQLSHFAIRLKAHQNCFFVCSAFLALTPCDSHLQQLRSFARLSIFPASSFTCEIIYLLRLWHGTDGKHTKWHKKFLPPSCVGASISSNCWQTQTIPQLFFLFFFFFRLPSREKMFLRRTANFPCEGWGVHRFSFSFFYALQKNWFTTNATQKRQQRKYF